MINKVQIADKAYWIGKVDDRKVPFHRLVLEKGTTYNSYFLDTDKPTIIDTVDIAFAGEWVKALAEMVDLKRLQYLVVNHVEPDHAGAVGSLMSKAKNAAIVTTEKGKEFLIGMFKLQNAKFIVIKDGDTLDIGGKTLKFLETPYLHTEETMVTYSIEDKILYPCDQFSTHIANYELFNDSAKEDITEDFKVYYSLIMHPHRPYVKDMLTKIKRLDIDMIAPSHGYILRDNANKYIELYDEMSTLNTKKNLKALLLLSSMTGNTSKVAQSLAQGLNEMNIENTVVNVKNAEMETIIASAKEADLILVGSSTKYGDMIGNLEDVLKELTKLDLSGKFAAAFGSYGWSGEAIEVISDYLNSTNATVLTTSYLIKSTGAEDIRLPLRVAFTPDEASKNLCIRTAKAISEVLLRA
ncbi:FprA family A-type flavoprotein [Clostridium omnivorum]|uniref:MBL fold hydrolase n=1 Tax=Clostridium omnivorum TaxID=1604902 RepID=A0ABQ5N681_9CLOT|nr:FprA family A-type flavoprotein [Clostridium sp. E14]GLC30646.1 MBL fold hydrolase [Clostridium sp. E14]